MKSNVVKNFKLYHRGKCPAYVSAVKNAIFISANNNIKHSLAKTKMAHEILNEGGTFITEVTRRKANPFYSKETKNRIIDLVDLSSKKPSEYEFEYSGTEKQDTELNFKILSFEKWNKYKAFIQKYSKEWQEFLNGR